MTYNVYISFTICLPPVVTDPSEHAAELMAAYRPRCPIIAISSDVKSARNLRLYRGILPAIYEAPPKEDWSDEMDSRIAFAIDFAWDRLVICAGSQVRYPMTYRVTNSRIKTILYQRLVTAGGVIWLNISR